MTPERDKALLVCVPSSTLQLAVFRAFAGDTIDAIVIGNRGVPGDVIYEHSILNDPTFLSDLERIIAGRDVEVFIPNSLNLLYFFCAVNKRVIRISYVDEGRLTKEYIEGGFKKPAAPHSPALLAATGFATMLPGVVGRLAFSGIASFIRRFVVRKYVNDPTSYPYTTVERRVKPGVVVSHLRCDDPQEWMQFVDITVSPRLPNDYAGRTCLFLHPKDSANRDLADLLKGKLNAGAQPLLVRPHPLFNQSRELLEETISRIEAAGFSCEIASLSGEHETAVELYARGVRTFVCGDSSLIDTVDGHKSYFKNLRVVVL